MKNVVVEPFSTINNNVEIGEGTWVGSNVTIMEGARIGKNRRGDTLADMYKSQERPLDIDSYSSIPARY